MGEMMANNMILLDHPACFPDMKPIENVWVDGNEVYRNERQFQTVYDLREAIFSQPSADAYIDYAKANL